MRRRRQAFWREFEAAFGPPSEPPDSYWYGWLGHATNLRPADLADITAEQLLDAHRTTQQVMKRGV